MQYTIFYTTYSTNETVAPDDQQKLSKKEIADVMRKQLLHNGDYFGIVDDENATLQFMRGNQDRVWVEVPIVSEQGSYGTHMQLDEAISLVEGISGTVAPLAKSFTFQSWDGTTGETPFAIAEEELKPLAEGLGSCFATDMVTRGDRGVNYMYREEPSSDDDSGWRFFAGQEPADYMENPANTSIYDVNTIANYEPDIIPLLNSPAGSEFERDATGSLVKV